MNTNSLSNPALYHSEVQQYNLYQLVYANYWKITLSFLLALILGGFTLNMISGWATIILIGSMITAMALKPILEILNMDFDLDNLEIEAIHEELW